MQRAVIIIALLFILFPPFISAKEKEVVSITHEELMERLAEIEVRCQRYRANSRSSIPRLDRRDLSKIFFLANICDIAPGQRRYSIENVSKHVNELMAEAGVFRDPQTGRWVLPQRAIVGLADAEPALLVNGRLILLDGHHSLLACIFVGCQEFPIHVVGGRMQLYLTNFRNTLRRWLPIRWFHEMENDPLLMAVRQVRARISMNPGGNIRLQDNEHPVWITFKGEANPEIRIADALRADGFRLPGDYDGTISPEIEADMRERLARMHRRGSRYLVGIEIVPTRIPAREINLKQIFSRRQRYLIQHPCIPFFADYVKHL